MFREAAKKIIAAGLLGFAISCAAATNGPDVAITVEEEHPISVDSQTVTLTLAASRDGVLSGIDQARLRAFAGSYLREGHGPISVTTPSGGDADESAARTAFSARGALYEAGVREGHIQSTSYAAAQKASRDIIISYTHYVATPSACGVWQGTRGRDYRNLRSPNFGCASQNNLAAMIADPRDLVSPAEMTPPDSAIRIRGVNAFRAGQVTSTAQDNRIEARVSQ